MARANAHDDLLHFIHLGAMYMEFDFEMRRTTFSVSYVALPRIWGL